MAKRRFYVVLVGRKPGLYDKWSGAGGAEEAVRNFSGATFQRVPTQEAGQELFLAKYGIDAPVHFSHSDDVHQSPSFPTEQCFTTYALLDSRDQKPFYVGQTQHPEQRMQRHHDRWRTLRSASGRIARKLDRAIAALPSPPIFFVLERTESKRESLESETKWVRYCQAKGYELANSWIEHQWDYSQLPD